MPPSDDIPTVARTVVTHPALRAGDRLFGRFVLEAQLGRGGMGVVWRARDEQLGETVALKFLPEPLAGDPRALADLRTETRRARQLSHPHIVRIHEFFADDHGAAVAMEFIEGRSLAAALAERGAHSPEEILAWLPDLAAALDYAHREAKVVHRDLKPGNVLLPATGGAKLADFGVSCRISETATRCTHQLVGGTLAYMSPQQLSGEEPCPADDIYGLGALLYELVTARTPFAGGDLSFQIRERAPVRPSARRDAAAGPLPAAWDEAILACLEKDAARRPASAGEVLAMLRGERIGGRVRRSWRRPLVAGLVALAAIVPAVVAVSSVWRRVAGEGPASTAPASLPPLAAPELVRGSLGRNLVAHLPLAGDHANYASDRGRATAVGLGWTEDRFGRKDSAYVLSGRSHLELPLGPFFHLGAGTRFTLMAWVRVDEGNGGLLSLFPAAGGTGFAQLSLLGGKLTGYLVDRRTFLMVDGGDALSDRRWHHVALSYDGAQVRVHLDGVVVAAREWEHTASTGTGITLAIGPKDLEHQHKMVRGAVADVRLYRGVLIDDPLMSIVREDAPAVPPDAGATAAWFPWERPTTLGITRGLYEIHEDWNLAVQREYGPDARVADCADVAGLIGRWPRLAAELAAIPAGQTLRVTRGGERFFSPERVYELTRVDGVVQETFLVHAEFGNYTFVLGSWMEPPLQALSAVVPTSGRYRIETGEVRDGSWRRDLGVLAAEERFCVRVPFATDVSSDAPVAVEFIEQGGARWRVGLRQANQPRDRRLQISGPGAGVDHNVEFAVNPTPHELIVVGRRGHLYAAVLDAGSGAWRGDLVTDSAGITIESLQTLVVSGAVATHGAHPGIQWVVWH